MKKYRIEEAIKMLENKRGVGVKKHTKVNINIQIDFDSGTPGVGSFLSNFQTVLYAITSYRSIQAGFTLENVKIKDKSTVETEHESNPNWKI